MVIKLKLILLAEDRSGSLEKFRQTFLAEEGTYGDCESMDLV